MIVKTTDGEVTSPSYPGDEENYRLLSKTIDKVQKHLEHHQFYSIEFNFEWKLLLNRNSLISIEIEK